MSNIDVPLIPGALGDGYCFTTWQQLYEDMFNAGIGQFPNNATVWNFGSTIPDADHRDRPWARTNPDGSFDKVYVWFNGIWCSPHPVPPADSDTSTLVALSLWKGTEVELETYDGGAAGTNTTTTGPMWTVDHDFDFRFPIGPGTSPAPLSTAISIGGTGGEEEHLLAAGESGTSAHTHSEQCGDGSWNAIGGAGANRQTFGTGMTDPVASGMSTAESGETEARLAHNNMPPYRGVFFIKRTIRAFYTVS